VTDTPIDYTTVDPEVWAAAFLDALEHDPDVVGTVAGVASWFAAVLENGRRNP